MKVNDFLYGILIYFSSLFSILFFIALVLQGWNMTDEVFMIFTLTYLLIILMVVCTRIILRSINGPLKWDSLEDKIRSIF